MSIVSKEKDKSVPRLITREEVEENPNDETIPLFIRARHWSEDEFNSQLHNNLICLRLLRPKEQNGHLEFTAIKDALRWFSDVLMFNEDELDSVKVTQLRMGLNEVAEHVKRREAFNKTSNEFPSLFYLLPLVRDGEPITPPKQIFTVDSQTFADDVFRDD
jgi:hypothetical protein